MSGSGGANPSVGDSNRKRKTPPFLHGLSGLMFAAYVHRRGVVFARNGTYAPLPATGRQASRSQVDDAEVGELLDFIEAWGRQPGGSIFIARWVGGGVDPMLQAVSDYIMQAETLEFTSLVGGMRLGALTSKIEDGFIEVEEAEVADHGFVRPKKGGHKLRVGASVIVMEARTHEVIEKIKREVLEKINRVLEKTYGPNSQDILRDYPYYHVAASNKLVTPVLAPAPLEAFRRAAAWEAPLSEYIEEEKKRAIAVIDQMRKEGSMPSTVVEAGDPKHYQGADAASVGKDRDKEAKKGRRWWRLFFSP